MADGTTMVKAIADVRSYIDDREGRRWDREQCVRAIHSALSQCMEHYARAGGERFDVEESITTVGTTGVSLIEQDPLTIRTVHLTDASGGWRVRLRAADMGQVYTPDTETRYLVLRYVPRPKLPQQDDDVMCGLIPGTQRPWPAFERWVCMRAAMELGITDKDSREDLYAAEDRLRVEVTSADRIPKMLPWPRPSAARYGDVRWRWFPGTAVLSLVNAYSGG